jgi:hypothetical protein
MAAARSVTLFDNTIDVPKPVHYQKANGMGHRAVCRQGFIGKPFTVLTRLPDFVVSLSLVVGHKMQSILLSTP